MELQRRPRGWWPWQGRRKARRRRPAATQGATCGRPTWNGLSAVAPGRRGGEWRWQSPPAAAGAPPVRSGGCMDHNQSPPVRLPSSGPCSPAETASRSPRRPPRRPPRRQRGRAGGTGRNRFACGSRTDRSNWLRWWTTPYLNTVAGVRHATPPTFVIHGSCVQTSGFPPVGARGVAARGCLALALLWGTPGALLKSKPMTGLLKPCGVHSPWASARPEQPHTP